MKVLEYIFKLLLQFIQFEGGRYEELKRKAELWYETEQKKEGSKWAKLINLNEQWYIQVLLAVFFVVSVKSIRNWILSAPKQDADEDEDDDDDDDDEDEDMPSRLKNKVGQKLVNQFMPFKL
jgi:hypothetical protein